MRKIIVICTCLSLVLGIVGCTQKSNKEGDKNISIDTSNKSLVVYFSMPETTNAENMTTEEANSVVVANGEVLGNTQYVAMVLQEQVNGDIYRIETIIPYTTNHEDLVEQADMEQETNARPEIKDTINNFDQYTNIYIGYPIWWNDMPQIMYTFFDTYDFSGKVIIPFSTHGGSGLSGTIDTIKKLEPNASIYEDALTINRNDVQESKAEIIDWVKNSSQLK